MARAILKIVNPNEPIKNRGLLPKFLVITKVDMVLQIN